MSKAKSNRTPQLPIERRQAIFAAVVEGQDQGIGATAARQRIARLFKVSEVDVLRIEAESLVEEWPPL